MTDDDCWKMVDAIGGMRNDGSRAIFTVCSAWPRMTAEQRHVVTRSIETHIGHWFEDEHRGRGGYDQAWHALLEWVWGQSRRRAKDAAT